MKITCRKTTHYEMNRYPEYCAECPAFSTTVYSCYEGQGTEGHCELGCFVGSDMRDFDGGKLFEGCDMMSNPNVTVTPSEGEESAIIESIW